MKPGIYSTKFNRRKKQYEPNKLLMPAVYTKEPSGWHKLELEAELSITQGNRHMAVFSEDKGKTLTATAVDTTGYATIAQCSFKKIKEE